MYNKGGCRNYLCIQYRYTSYSNESQALRRMAAAAPSGVWEVDLWLILGSTNLRCYLIDNICLLDLELILKKSPLLIQEMVNCISQLFYYYKADASEYSDCGWGEIVV